jgi:hypothetical protein
MSMYMMIIIINSISAQSIHCIREKQKVFLIDNDHCV